MLESRIIINFDCPWHDRDQEMQTNLDETGVHEYSSTQRIQDSADDACGSATWVIEAPNAQANRNSCGCCKSVKDCASVWHPVVARRELHVGES